jgi:hypothetical protein
MRIDRPVAWITALLLAVPAAAFAQGTPDASADPAATTAVVTPVATAAAGATCPKCPDEVSYRELAGHVFMPSHLMSDPFSYTAFGLYWGAGLGTATGPRLVQTNPPPNPSWALDWSDPRSYDYVGLGLGLALNVRILEYLSVNLALGTSAYLGDSSASLLVVGTNAQLNGALSVKGSLPLGEHVRVSVSAGMEYGPIFSALIAQGIIRALQSGELDMLQAEKAVTWTAAGAVAWSPWRPLGLVGNARFYFPTGGGNAQYAANGVSLSAMADFDAGTLVPWLPLGVNAVYGILTPFGQGGTTTQEYGFGLWYTGRKALAVGLELDWRRGRIASQLVSTATLAWLNLRYYWGP